MPSENHAPPAEPRPGAPAKAPAGWVRVAALAVITAVVLYLCYLLLVPVLPGVAWGVALAALSLPLHKAVSWWVRNDSVSAGVTTTLIVLLLVVPLVLVGAQLAVETAAVGQRVKDEASSGRWRDRAEQVPYVGEWLRDVDDHLDLEQEARGLLGRLGSLTVGLVGGTTWASLQVLIGVFVLYFCLRDRRPLMDAVRTLIPLDPRDTAKVIGRADDAVHATVYGTVLTGLLQGVTGGLMFWLLGLPAPVLWGFVMFVLSVLPVVGAVLVWLPAAVHLTGEGQVGKAAALVAWGLLMAGPVGNYVYAVVAGDRMRMHPVPALLAFVGGLAAFGLSGIVLGPAVVAVAAALLDVWRERVMQRRPPEPAAAPDPAAERLPAGVPQLS